MWLGCRGNVFTEPLPSNGCLFWVCYLDLSPHVTIYIHTIWSKVSGHPSVVVNRSLDVTTTAFTGIRGGRKLCVAQLLSSTSKMGRSGELSDFEHGLVIGCHISKKSVTDIATLLKLPKLTAGDVIVKWKREGTTTTKPRPGRPCLTHRGCWPLKKVVRENSSDIRWNKHPWFLQCYELSSQHTDCASRIKEEWGSMGEQLPINQTFCLWTLSAA
jgi:hypothetical protein